MSSINKLGRICFFTAMFFSIVTGCGVESSGRSDEEFAQVQQALQPGCSDGEDMILICAVNWNTTSVNTNGNALELPSTATMDEAWFEIDASGATCDVSISPSQLTTVSTGTPWFINSITVPSACQDAASDITLWVRQGDTLSSFNCGSQ